MLGKALCLRGIGHLAIQRADNLCSSKRRFFAISRFNIERNDCRHPALAINHIRTPTQLLNRFEHTTCIEYGTLYVVVIFLAALVGKHGTLVKIVVVVDEIHLHAGSLY